MGPRSIALQLIGVSLKNQVVFKFRQFEKPHVSQRSCICNPVLARINLQTASAKFVSWYVHFKFRVLKPFIQPEKKL